MQDKYFKQKIKGILLLLLQLLMEPFDTLPIQCGHIEHVHEGVWFTKNDFDKMTAVRT